MQALPPVRRPVPLVARRVRKPLAAAFGGWGVRICGSGTQALAMALADARMHLSATEPEVILPAYGCPDLVTASVYAGLRPRLVDTAPRGRWGYDLGALRRVLSGEGRSGQRADNCAAIVAVNLLGTGDQAVELAQIATETGIALIQDSAQHLPRRLPAQWLGDYVVLSFGRGKPLNLLGGGALLHHPDRADDIASQEARPMKGPMESPLLGQLAGLAFNLATRPYAYGLARRLMGSAVGGTRYEALEALHEGSARKIAAVESGLAGYEVSPGYDASMWSAACAAWATDGVEMLSCASQTAPDMLRLRLAMLAPDGKSRDAIVTALEQKGLGASAMYGETMEKLDAVPAAVASQGPFPNAADLARRLFTLPTHSCVGPAALRETQAIVAGLLRH
jgi:dTDP-4-amino-4,6-dideoxygalactose transaminase